MSRINNPAPSVYSPDFLVWAKDNITNLKKLVNYLASSGGGGGGTTPNLDQVTTEGYETANTISVGGIMMPTGVGGYNHITSDDDVINFFGPLHNTYLDLLNNYGGGILTSMGKLQSYVWRTPTTTGGGDLAIPDRAGMVNILFSDNGSVVLPPSISLEGRRIVIYNTVINAAKTVHIKVTAGYGDSVQTSTTTLGSELAINQGKYWSVELLASPTLTGWMWASAPNM